MKQSNGIIELSATDLVGHLNCKHLTELDLAVATGNLAKPEAWDPLLEALRERGRRHEENFLRRLREQDLNDITIEGIDIDDRAVDQTREAMNQGTGIIVQAALKHGRWSGRADILRRVDTPSNLGNWSYEIIDTKLARETKAGSVLQLCLYAHLLEQAQGNPPKRVYVVAPWSDFKPQEFRYADYAAYFRKAKIAVENAIRNAAQNDAGFNHYPDPKEHCDICRWRAQCEQRRRDDDHLCLVAGISKSQITELQERNITTMTALAGMQLPLTWNPKRGAEQGYRKIREQARIQVESREAPLPLVELLPIDPEQNVGLCLLPEPSPGDVFFDIEGDPFVGEHGLEYLFGYMFCDESGKWIHRGDWAFDIETEKAVFERFVDLIIERLELHPDLHIYHYAPYESAALKRLMGRYATRENEIDGLLRGHVMVDLYKVVRNAARVGVESYSIKKLEPVYLFERSIPLQDANQALANLQAGLELGGIQDVSEEIRNTVRLYNQDDCASTLSLRNWLEEKRREIVEKGECVPRPELPDRQANMELTKRDLDAQRLIEKLVGDISPDIGERSNEEQAKWVLAYLLEWHRREEKAVWWEYFRLSEMTAEELIDEKAAISGLTLVDMVDETETGIPTHRYSFPQQETDLRGGEKLRSVGGGPLGTMVTINANQRTLDISKSRLTEDLHPEAVFAFDKFDHEKQESAIFRIGEYVADHGIQGAGPYFSGRELLLRGTPRISGQAIRQDGEEPHAAALRIADYIDGGILPIQGPPGTGKTYSGARMICRLVNMGKKVGITANSHKVIRNLIDKVLEVSNDSGVPLTCIQKPGDFEYDQARLIFAYRNREVFSALSSGRCQVAGGTSYVWSDPGAIDKLDVLVVDEAAQMSLANALAISQSAKAIVLLGDPQQLDQPTQGSHPDGTDASALRHILGEEQTIPPEQGLFLETTWRMHPDICSFNSELFYNERLFSIPGCERQEVVSNGPVSGSGLRFLPVAHSGNQSFSIEEADIIEQLVKDILASEPTWVNRDGDEQALTLNDILIITPYNAQIFKIRQRLRDARIGTVDKFQGQEAPIVIYSMATSSYADAPRGMEFLYSANRFNVAISRAKCLAILVASPEVFEVDCKTPRQMRLANAFCLYIERAQELDFSLGTDKAC